MKVRVYASMQVPREAGSRYPGTQVRRNASTLVRREEEMQGSRCAGTQEMQVRKYAGTQVRREAQKQRSRYVGTQVRKYEGTPGSRESGIQVRR